MTRPGSQSGLWHGAGSVSNGERPALGNAVDASFEVLLKDLAVDFVRVPAMEVDDEIERWLRRIVEYFDADRSSISEISQTGIAVSHSWAREGYQVTLGTTERSLPWLAARLLRGEMFTFSRPDDFPPEASAERDLVAREGIKSHISVPLVVAGGVVGAMGIAYMRHECPWVEEILRRVQLVATVLASALARKRAVAERLQMVDALAHAERVASVSTLASSFAHELNQPLAASLTNAESALRLLDADPPDLREVREALEDIAADNRRAGDIVRELRGYLRKHEPNVESVDLAGLIPTIARFILPEARTRAVQLRFEVAEGISRVAIDRVQVQQALVNLLLNAFHALSAQSPATRAAVVTVAPANAGRVAISVRDSGPGIPEAMLKRVFVPFATTKPDGVGLGLAICQTIATAHGGPLIYSTASDGGAVFTFTVPVARDRGLGD
jgi:signal transduction histidine kinase